MHIKRHISFHINNNNNNLIAAVLYAAFFSAYLALMMPYADAPAMAIAEPTAV
jgi:hypothetical protein